MASHVSQTPGDLVVASLPDEPKKLVCVEFPGIVENEERAITCLGGYDALSKAHFDKNRHLEVRFRPEDQYCKPAVARAKKSSCLVLKVKRKRRLKSGERQTTADGDVQLAAAEMPGDKVQSLDENTDRAYDYSAELLGVVNTVYCFPGMTDYQALPPGLNGMLHNGALVDPKDFQITEPVDESFIDRDLPAFLPPDSFSKLDRPTTFALTREGKTISKPEDTRKGPTSTKSSNSYGIAFDFTDSVPTKPPDPGPLASNLASHPCLPQLIKLFEERPVWSAIPLQLQLDLSSRMARNLIALVAYKFTTGPFKKTWVKFGYDPRIDSASKVYQSIDIRVPSSVTTVKPSSLHRKRGLQKSTIAEELVGSAEQPVPESNTVDETMFVYYPDRLPSRRQLYYQLCDIKDEKLQELIHSNDGREVECTEADGWCVENTYENLRKSITSEMKKLAAKTADAKSPSITNREPNK